MNAAEKIAGVYLRLNGFLLLPHFTVFDGDMHGHLDWIGLRAARSEEVGANVPFPTDTAFFDAIPPEVCPHPREILLGLAAEVRTNKERDRPDASQVEYVRKFLGNATVLKASFFESNHRPTWSEECIEVGNEYALKWIFERVAWMNENHWRLTKSGSWPWSDDALADFLVLYRYGAFKITQHDHN